MKEELGVEKFDSIIVASGTVFADALAGSYLAYVKNAPLLITAETFGNSAPYIQINEYIKANLADGGTVYVLGGTAAVSEACVADLSDLNVKRVWGKNRFETNIEILKEAGVTDEDILVCTADDFADSLSASAAKKPILLVRGTELSEIQKEYLAELGTENFYVIGGEAAVDSAIETELKEYGTVERVYGKTRHETSVKTAETFFGDISSAVMAYSYNFPDGLCGGPLAAVIDAPILLIRENKEEYAKEYLSGFDISKGYVCGGSSILSDEVIRSVFQMGDDEEIVVK